MSDFPPSWTQTSLSGFEFNLDHKGKLCNGILATRVHGRQGWPTAGSTGLPTFSPPFSPPRSPGVAGGANAQPELLWFPPWVTVLPTADWFPWLFPQAVSEASFALQSSSAPLAWDFASTLVSTGWCNKNRRDWVVQATVISPCSGGGKLKVKVLAW